LRGAAVDSMLITEAGRLPPSSVCAISVTLHPKEVILYSLSLGFSDE
jgi:hypothetical protein